jgi:hypothetical protein
MKIVIAAILILAMVLLFAIKEKNTIHEYRMVLDPPLKVDGGSYLIIADVDGNNIGCYYDLLENCEIKSVLFYSDYGKTEDQQ